MALSDKDFLGLEVVGLDEAAIVGTVQGLIVDDAARAVAALIVNTGAHQSRVVPFAVVRSVGDDAVVIVDTNARQEQKLREAFASNVLRNLGRELWTRGILFTERGVELVARKPDHIT